MPMLPDEVGVAAGQALVSLSGVSFSYPLPGGGSRPALRNLSLLIRPGERIVVLGANGAGKSTLAALIAGVARPTAGEISRAARAAAGRPLVLPAGYVTQNPEDSFSSPLVREEMGVVLENLGREHAEIDRTVEATLAEIGLAGHGDAHPARLSGGQKQLLAIASVLVAEPPLLVLDEPLTLLDGPGRAEVGRLLARERGPGAATVFLSSEVEDAARGDRVIVLYRGAIAWEGTPAELPQDAEPLSAWGLLPQTSDDARPVDAGETVQANGWRAPDSLRCEPAPPTGASMGGFAPSGAVDAAVTPAGTCRRRGGAEGRSPSADRREHKEGNLPGFSGPGSDRGANETHEPSGLVSPGWRSCEWVESEGGPQRQDPAACTHTPCTLTKDIAPPAIAISGLHFSYDPGTPRERPVLRGVDLAVRCGELLGVVGANGSGKTTLIQHLNGLLPPQSGRVVIGDRVLEPGVRIDRLLHCEVGLVFQFPEKQLFAETVDEDVAAGPEFAGVPEEAIPGLVRAALERVGLDPEADGPRAPFALSWGEKRLAAIAGVLVLETPILALDEPGAGLDPAGRRRLMELLGDLAHREGRTVVVVSHHLDDLFRVADRIVVLHEGRIACTAAPADLLRERDLPLWGLAPAVTPRRPRPRS